MGKESAEVQVAVVCNPEFQTNPAGAFPESVRIVWTRGDSILWTLLASDEKARIHDIRFDFGDPSGPFDVLGPVRGTEGRQWCGQKPKEGSRVFKYTVVVVDGEGRQHDIDPFVLTDDKP
ncbi:MAG: hypothetical protein AAGN66_06420 [Acidobacteriota bacterium]